MAAAPQATAGVRMASLALNLWRTRRAAALAEIDAVHRSIDGMGALRRAAMQQLNQAYVLLLASEFQGFCRDLHTESADALILGLPSADLQSVIYRGLMLRRKLVKERSHVRSSLGLG